MKEVDPWGIIEKLRLQHKAEIHEQWMPLVAEYRGQIEQLQSRLESLEKDAVRYKLQKMFPALRVGEFHGKFRAECGSMILTDWLDSYDEAFDTAMQANKQ